MGVTVECLHGMTWVGLPTRSRACPVGPSSESRKLELIQETKNFKLCGSSELYSAGRATPPPRTPMQRRTAALAAAPPPSVRTAHPSGRFRLMTEASSRSASAAVSRSQSARSSHILDQPAIAAAGTGRSCKPRPSVSVPCVPSIPAQTLLWTRTPCLPDYGEQKCALHCAPRTTCEPRAAFLQGCHRGHTLQTTASSTGHSLGMHI